MRIAIIAPLVAAIREPQRGGSQAFVADLARGLIGRGHEVHLYAASGSDVPGVPVIDTGVDHRPLSAALYRASGAADRPSAATESAFARVYSAVREDQYDVIHNHAFDAPAIRLATGLGAPVVHTVHLPPEDAVAAALGHAAETDAPPTVAGVSEFQASAWRRVVPIDAILPPYVPTSLIGWSPGAGDGAVFAGRLSPEKGAAEAIDIARAAGVRIDVYGDSYDAEYVRARIDPRGPSRASASIQRCRERLSGRRWHARPSFSARRSGTSRSAWSPLRRRRAGHRSSHSIAAHSARSSWTSGPGSSSLPTTSTPQPTPSRGRRDCRVRNAARMPNAAWISGGASRLMNGSTGESSALVPEPRSMAESRHWLSGRLAVVTGASRGIGAATAEAMAAAGAHVVLAARDREALDGIAARIRDGGGEATPAPTDVSKAGEVERLFADVDGMGSLAALVCAAGVLKSAPFAEMTAEVWAETLDVNLTGSFLCCREAFNAMRRSGEGRIVNFASLSGVYATEKFPGLAAYNVSKYGVIGLTEAIAAEGKEHGISAVCISPGAVDTAMLRQANPELRPGLTPGDVAELIVALLDSPLEAASGANIPLFSNA